ncbi:hypothetical protein [Brevifollis gellanilyticus]|uniref:Malectin domain-containing protein n=1 Tax=Brevifollis gellanilyticus TaxID=748831 RepID=A0A512M6A4_9BACT|nr:hypothetical protein [Brevifollis gellanilyticus]GEP42267.1 hypothetical protein BGE01nite_15580 [Brevifollis gellanilyticus]
MKTSRLLLTVFGISNACLVHAQTPVPAPAPVPAAAPVSTAPVSTGSPAVDASSPDSRLRQLETIYQQQLRSRHIPLLGKHLTELQQAGRGAPTPALQAEIVRVQSVITAGGVVDLTAAARELNPAVPAPALPPMPDRPRRMTLMLTPSLAQSIMPVPESSASPVGASIGQLTWKLDALPAGEYDLVLHYASVLADAEVPVSVELAGQKLTQTLDAAKATKDGKNFRLLRLGQIKLDQDASGSSLVLTAGTADKPSLIVRNLVISRATKKPVDN